MLVTLLLTTTVRSLPSSAALAFPVASAGPQAGARIDATVTRVIDGRRVRLPAAEVPALEPGDQVDIRFVDFVRPPAQVNYHVNVAFLTEAAPQHWLFPTSGPWDRLFVAPRQRGRHAARPSRPVADLRFTYGVGDRRGIPVVFIVPEDDKTRGMDGVRDYVDAHPTEFKDMAVSSNAAIERYQWFADFLGSLSQGAIDTVASQQRVIDIATSLGASPAVVQACYAAGGTPAEVTACVQSSVQSIGYQTNIEAPTEAQFLGGVAGAAAPTTIAAFLVPLLTVWHLFAQNGHHDYEYLPTTLAMGAPGVPAAQHPQELLGMKVPTLRPPAAASDVLFFTIGDPGAAQLPPAVVDDAASTGVCATTPRLDVPLHVDRTSPYVHDTALLVTPDGGAPYAVPLDPHQVDAPVLARDALHGASDGGYDVRLTGGYGFGSLRTGTSDEARIALPVRAAWTVAPMPHQPPTAGRDLDLLASSGSAACLTAAELQQGSGAPVSLTIKRRDDRRVELRGSPAAVAGAATLRLYEDDPLHRVALEDDATIAIAPPPAQVDAASEPIAYLGDRSLFLTGTRLQTIAGVRFDGATYVRTDGSTAQAACFSGPVIAGLTPGASVSAQLLPGDGAPGEIFSTMVATPRPALEPAAGGAGQVFSTQPLPLVLAARGALPERAAVRVRQAPASGAPCDAQRADGPQAATLPDADVRRQTDSALNVVLDAADALHDRAFGTLQVQLVDTARKIGSDWITLPETFVRAPAVSHIECPSDPQAPCTLVGTGLDAIVGVEDAPGPDQTPGLTCTADVKDEQCVSVPHLGHYTLRLEDRHAEMRVPDALVVQAGGAAGKASG